MELQRSKPVGSGYIVALADLGLVLEVYGTSIVLPMGLPAGFYVTLINFSVDGVTIQTDGAALRTVNGSRLMTDLNQMVTVARFPADSTDWIAQGL